MSNWVKGLGTVAVLGSLMVLASCEWESSGGDNSFNSAAFSWVNFSGVYRGSGGALVSAYSTGGGGGLGSTNVVANEGLGSGNGVKTTFSGILNNHPIVPGSLSISAGGVDIVDQGDGSMVGGGATGSIDYGTGAWSIDLLGLPLGNGQPITADYAWIAVPGGGGGAGGSSGSPIFSFTLFQAGNKLEITDNNGGRYTGRIGKLQTTGGIDANSPDTVTPSVGDSAVAEFTAKGTSPAGVSVLLVGTLQGVASGSTGEGGGALFFSDRRIQGQWLETGGVNGNIDGQAAPIGIAATVTTP